MRILKLFNCVFWVITLFWIFFTPEQARAITMCGMNQVMWCTNPNGSCSGNCVDITSGQPSCLDPQDSCNTSYSPMCGGYMVMCAPSTDCHLGGVTYANNQHSPPVYTKANVPCGQTCPAQQVLTCKNGVWKDGNNVTVSNPSSTCDVLQCNKCLFDGIFYPHTSQIQAYPNGSTPCTNPCPNKATYTCNDGVWGPGGPPHASCHPSTCAAPANVCSWAGVNHPEGDTVSAFTSSVGGCPSGSCTTAIYTCTSGAWTNSTYPDMYATCDPSMSCSGTTSCTNAGQITWLPTPKKVMWCDGTSYVDPSSTTGNSCAPEEAGKIKYIAPLLSYCNGTNWISMKGPKIGTCSPSEEGKFVYKNGLYKFCDGADWRKMGL